jgi:hypothetical protein
MAETEMDERMNRNGKRTMGFIGLLEQQKESPRRSVNPCDDHRIPKYPSPISQLSPGVQITGPHNVVRLD